MKQIFLIITLALFLLLTACGEAIGKQSNTVENHDENPNVTHGVQLLNNAISGMSPKDILSKEKGSRWYVSRRPEPDFAQEIVRVDNYLWNGEAYIASFFFHSCQLASVRLDRPAKYKSFEAAMKQNITYIEMLNKIYGTFIKKELMDVLQIFRVTWETEDLRIRFGINDYSGKGDITFAFRPSVQPDFKSINLDPNNQSCWPSQDIIDLLHPKPRPFDSNGIPTPKFRPSPYPYPPRISP